ncbi:DUF488 family protein [Alteromonas ponticola]|uniref:DUF488 family protein n=1 Tax=Alteromonas ponticola TaxID=2720613 RepID=A0ABX1R5X4_9ALTE|nr:DUF488 family protein [Alteromonas ponticola]
MNYKIHRIYEDDCPSGYRILVDKLWPRGISKSQAKLDDWWKNFAPDDELREWFDHEPAKWAAFRKKYLHQLSKQKNQIKSQLNDVSSSTIVLLYGSKNKEKNHARVLREYFARLKI